MCLVLAIATVTQAQVLFNDINRHNPVFINYIFPAKLSDFIHQILLIEAAREGKFVGVDDARNLDESRVSHRWVCL